MTSPALENIVNAVLYEGHILYPYRPSAKKNQRERFTFGRVYPKGYSDSQNGAEPRLSQTECLLEARGTTVALEVTVRFLHPMCREVGHISGLDEATFKLVPALTVNSKLYQSWQEATEREKTVLLELPHPPQSGVTQSAFSFPASAVLEIVAEGVALRRRNEALEGMLEIESTPLSEDTFKISARVTNQTPINAEQCQDQDAVMMRTFASTHTVLRAKGGEFFSLLDPPAAAKPFAGQCRNIGCWPVLIGDERMGTRDTLLSSPIILYDYPQVAPESGGTFFDGTEIDEMLTLRIMTMTDDEKREMGNVEESARRLLQRIDGTTPDQLWNLHGTMRATGELKDFEDFFNPAKRKETVLIGGRAVRAGSRVRIHPKGRADAIDMLLEGKNALVEAIEEDAEGRAHLALVLEDDPGKDLGLARQTGHRFFYRVDEVEPLEDATL